MVRAAWRTVTDARPTSGKSSEVRQRSCVALRAVFKARTERYGIEKISEFFASTEGTYVTRVDVGRRAAKTVSA
jgi:hypothetical protein